MKRILVAVSVVLTVFLSGCSLHIESKPSEPETSQSPTASPSLDSKILDVLRSQHPELEVVPDRQILSLVDSVCDALDAGTSPEELVTLMMDSGLEPGTAGGIVGVSVAAKCPQHKAEMQSFIDKYSGSGV